MKRKIVDSIMNIVCGHELRTQMTGIVGLAEIMRNTDKAYTIDEQKLFAGHILESSKNLMSITDRLYLWYCLYTGYPFTDTIFFLSREAVVELVEEEAGRYSNCNYSINFDASFKGVSIKGYPPLIIQALKELINNGYRFSVPGKIVSCEFGASVSAFHFTVTNLSGKTTIGEMKTYEAFKQFNRDKYEQQGLGIGIDIAKLAIARYKGGIYIEGVDDDPYSTITITIQLPILMSELNSDESGNKIAIFRT